MLVVARAKKGPQMPTMSWLIDAKWADPYTLIQGLLLRDESSPWEVEVAAFGSLPPAAESAKQ